MAEFRKWRVELDGSSNPHDTKRVVDPPGFDPAAAREVSQPVGERRRRQAAGGQAWRLLQLEV